MNEFIDENVVSKIKGYHFEWKHLLVLFVILIFFQIIISFTHQISLTELQDQTQDWYKRDSAEKIAGLTATSFELLIETSNVLASATADYKKEMIQAFNIIFSQQLLQENIEEVSVLVSQNNKILIIEDGTTLYNYLFTNIEIPLITYKNQKINNIYTSIHKTMIENEEIYTYDEEGQIFHVFVPFVPNGEYSGAVYLKIVPDFSFINRQVVSSYDQTALIFSALILFGLLSMFYISSYTVKERDETQRQLFKEREEHLREQIDHQKESLFTKRIYHTHHKAEKIMGFIKEDLNNNDGKNPALLKNRIIKYANFVSRTIYDMKWYDPPLHTIRGSIYNTDLNNLLTFLVENVFNRVSSQVGSIKFRFDLDESLPNIHVNEYVIWEIIEPLIQNCIDHIFEDNFEITIKTKYMVKEKQGYIEIMDNGPGIKKELLETNNVGIKKIFLENISTKSDPKNKGYGCYIAYEISRKCGWRLDASNMESGGSKMKIEINNIVKG